MQQGDSGGPLICRVEGHWKVFGVVTEAFACGTKGYPLLYARVSEYLKWINDHVQQKQ